MYIKLLKVYCSSSAAIACTFDWLIDRRSSVKTKLNCLINSLCFRVASITKKAKHGKYSVKVHSEKYSTCYMKTIWKISYKFVDAKINWLTGWYYSSTISCYSTFNISYRKRKHIFSFLFFYKHYYFLSLTYVACIQDLLKKSYMRIFFG